MLHTRLVEPISRAGLTRNLARDWIAEVGGCLPFYCELSLRLRTFLQRGVDALLQS